MPHRWFSLLGVYVCVAFSPAEPRYFTVGSLRAVYLDGSACVYEISGWGEVFVAEERCNTHRLPSVLKGPIRLAVTKGQLVFLDQEGKEHKTKIIKRSPPAPPSPVM
jgi:hypothetical protein